MRRRPDPRAPTLDPERRWMWSCGAAGCAPPPAKEQAGRAAERDAESPPSTRSPPPLFSLLSPGGRWSRGAALAGGGSGEQRGRPWSATWCSVGCRRWWRGWSSAREARTATVVAGMERQELDKSGFFPAVISGNSWARAGAVVVLPEDLDTDVWEFSSNKRCRRSSGKDSAYHKLQNDLATAKERLTNILQSKDRKKTVTCTSSLSFSMFISDDSHSSPEMHHMV